jgi:hypothetical protein
MKSRRIYKLKQQDNGGICRIITGSNEKPGGFSAGLQLKSILNFRGVA